MQRFKWITINDNLWHKAKLHTSFACCSNYPHFLVAINWKRFHWCQPVFSPLKNFIEHIKWINLLSVSCAFFYSPINARHQTGRPIVCIYYSLKIYYSITSLLWSFIFKFTVLIQTRTIACILFAQPSLLHANRWNVFLFEQAKFGLMW